MVVLPAFRHHEDWVRIMRHVIALNASHFNTQRMVQELCLKFTSNNTPAPSTEVFH
ncbi:MAG: hypothetical protein ACREIC_20195 [Limisphaerales bacterium]